jgi:hypothetical protein
MSVEHQDAQKRSVWVSPWRILTGLLVAVSVVILASIAFGIVDTNDDQGIWSIEVEPVKPSPETLAAIEQERATTEFKKTLLLSKGSPENVGVGSKVFASLQRVETLGELKWVLSDDVRVIVIDASAQQEPGLEAFVYEQWKAGRAIVGLNACFMNVPEQHDRNDPDPGRCVLQRAWRESAYPYATYLLPGWSTDARDFVKRFQEAGGPPPPQTRGGAALLIDSPQTACYPSHMLAHLESGVPGSFPGKCEESQY